MNLLNYFLFSVIYLYLTNWFQINAFARSFIKPKQSITTIKDQRLLSLIKRKTGLELKRIILFNTDRLFGMMPTIPWKPEMILSRGLYETFNTDELEWVVLHEAGHCILWHNVKCAIVEILFLILGLGLIKMLTFPLFFIPILAVILSIICVKMLRHYEYEADKFSITRVDNPQGVITAQHKFRKMNTEPYYRENHWFRKLFFWNIFPSERIKMARVRLSKM